MSPRSPGDVERSMATSGGNDQGPAQVGLPIAGGDRLLRPIRSTALTSVPMTFSTLNFLT